jgi:hypothetical protein
MQEEELNYLVAPELSAYTKILGDMLQGNFDANNWQPPQVTQTGQTSPLAPMIAGDWVFDFTNGYPPTNVSLSVVSVSQDNASKMNSINPIPLEPGKESYIPSNSAVDQVNPHDVCDGCRSWKDSRPKI